MKKRITAVFLSMLMFFSMLPVTAFSDEASNSIADISTAGLCEHHQQHDENCGYSESTEGTPCTFVCEICNGTEEEKLTESSGETFCTEDSVDSDSSDSSAEEADLTACKGAAPMLAAAAPLSVEHSGHDGWKELNGGLKGYLDGGNYVLTGDVLLYNDLLGKTNQNVIICLNGHEIDGNSENMQNLTICDCTGNGKIINTNLEAVSLSDIGLQGCKITGSVKLSAVSLFSCEITGSAEIDNSHIESSSISNMTDMTIASGTDILSSEINTGMKQSIHEMMTDAAVPLPALAKMTLTM